MPPQRPRPAAKPIEQSDAPSVPQENVPQESTLQVDGSKPTDAAATSSPAAAKPIEQSDASSIPQQNVPQESTLQVDGSKPTDAAATSSQPQNLSSRVTPLRFHNKTFRKKARYRSMDLN